MYTSFKHFNYNSSIFIFYLCTICWNVANKRKVVTQGEGKPSPSQVKRIDIDTYVALRCVAWAWKPQSLMEGVCHVAASVISNNCTRVVVFIFYISCRHCCLFFIVRSNSTQQYCRSIWRRVLLMWFDYIIVIGKKYNISNIILVVTVVSVCDY